MLSDPNILHGFFDELEAIEKQAVWGALARVGRQVGMKALGGSKALGLAAKGATKGGRALTGAQRWHAAGKGLKAMAPAAAVGATGLAAGYGAKKAVFG